MSERQQIFLDRLESNVEAAWDRYHAAVMTSAKNIEARGGEENLTEEERSQNAHTLRLLEAVAKQAEKELASYRRQIGLA